MQAGLARAMHLMSSVEKQTPKTISKTQYYETHTLYSLV